MPSAPLILAERDGTIAVSVSYDAANRPTSRTDTIDGEVFTTGYSYDGRDNLTTVTYPSGRVVSYDDDSADRVTHVAQSGQVWATSFGYHATGCETAEAIGKSLSRQ